MPTSVPAQSAPIAPIPALIVSGYLGAGKTTLVSHLLREAQATGVRVAIVSNEFGDTGIDRALLDAGQEGFVELDGGCVCCRLSDALGETLSALLTQVRPDRLILETSGVALPGDLLVQFWRPPISDLVSEEVVAVVVDVEKVLGEDGFDETFLEQIEAADVVVLNKCDLTDDAGLRVAEARIAELIGDQPVLHAIQGEVDPALLFPPDPSRTTRRDPAARTHDHHHERFGTYELNFPDPTTDDEVLAAVRAQHALRAKGFFRSELGIRLVQGVGARIEVGAPRLPPPEHLIGRVVVIRREAGDAPHEHGG